MKSTPLVIALLLAASFATASSRAEVKLPAIFSDHMVIQKGSNVPIWGKADPGEEVTISLDRYSARTTADPDGRWRTELDLRNADSGPFEMIVAGKNTIKISDVVVGEVWLASGQSNMQWPLEKTGAKEEIAQSANPILREFKVEKSAVPAPAEDCVGTWKVASPETSGGFSAIGYYFGKTLQSEIKVPVGIVNTIWGGSPAESWIGPAAIEAEPGLRASRDRKLDLLARAPALKTAFVEAFAKWLAENQREDRPTSDPAAFAAASVLPEGWTEVKLPGKPFDVTGAIWLRHEFEVPPSLAGKKTWFNLGPIKGFETVYLNGQLLTQTTYQNSIGEGLAHVASVPKGLILAGKNVLAIRIFAPVAPVKFSIVPKAGAIELQGLWLAKSEFDF
ncbi:MAG: hypothetical protein RIQ71_642, partial [Verrucomicrobiota bacterium]